MSVFKHFRVFGTQIEQVTKGEAYRRPVWSTHIAAAQALAHAGISLPREWQQLQAHYAAYATLGNDAGAQLAAAVIAGADPATLATMRSNAVTEQLDTNEALAATNTLVQAKVLEALEAAYRPAAQKNYRAAATAFDDAAQAFVNVCRAVNVEAGPAELMTVTSAQRDSWANAPALASRLDAAESVLLAAASLCGGVPGDAGVISAANDNETRSFQLAMVANPGKCHRRQVWTAWLTTDGRCHKWSKLVGLGVALRAASDPTKLEKYSLPVAPVAVTDKTGQVQYWDPHSGPLAEVLPGHQPVNTGWIDERPSVDAID